MEKNKQNGFTLIELLVVIAIIGLLSSVILPSLNKAREKARDVNRLATLRQIEKVINIYFTEKGRYPDSGNLWSCFNCTAYPSVAVDGGTLTTVLTPYFGGSSPPKDPQSFGWPADADYVYEGNQNTYCLMSYRNPENMKNFPLSVTPSRCLPLSPDGRWCKSSGGTYTGWDQVIQVGPDCTP